MPKKKAKERLINPTEAATQREQAEAQRAREQSAYKQYAGKCSLGVKLFGLEETKYVRHVSRKAAAGAASGAAAGAAAGPVGAKTWSSARRAAAGATEGATEVATEGADGSRDLFPGDPTTYTDMELELPYIVVFCPEAGDLCDIGPKSTVNRIQGLIKDLEHKFNDCIERCDGADKSFLVMTTEPFGMLFTLTRVTRVVDTEHSQKVELKVDVDMVVKKKIGSAAVSFNETVKKVGTLYKTCHAVLNHETLNSMIKEKRMHNKLSSSDWLDSVHSDTSEPPSTPPLPPPCDEKLLNFAAEPMPDGTWVPLQDAVAAAAEATQAMPMDNAWTHIATVEQQNGELKADTARLLAAMQQSYENNRRVLEASGLQQSHIDTDFEEWLLDLQSGQAMCFASNTVETLRFLHLLEFACGECSTRQKVALDHLRDAKAKQQELDTVNEELSKTKQASMVALQKLADDAATDAQTIQRLQQENSKLQAENAFSKEQRADLATATQQANALALKLQQLDDVASANSLQGRIEAEVAKRVAAVEEKHAAQLREKNEALTRHHFEQTSLRLDALRMDNTMLQMEQDVKDTLRIATFQHLVSRYSAQKLSWEIAKKEAQQEMASIKLITGHWYRLVLKSLLGKSKRREFKLFKRNIALTTKMTALIEQNQNLSASASLLQEQDVETPGNPDAAGAKHISLDEVVYECQLCLETDGPYVRLSPCGHVFCNKCVHEKDDSLDKKGSFCPTCRTVKFTSTDKTHLC